ncbi:DUF5634 family protein [Alkalihalobacillus sp. AL-G]|uniref:DUF5634 family protein n=1 Tax=Alkalihalobacillus sp. AL-G TaxID=2926399 RepID=UPI00272A34CE|nr:DUF5634 family protein [Alkalihalobacillus sp. AL-G]WLD93855.1 DUF5634 family protein [Alkalihalobacillus sp. AL-G]
MNYYPVDAIRNELQQHFEELLNEHDLDEIEIYEEEGPEDSYYMGYVVKKDEKVYMVNLPYKKNDQGEIGIQEQNWTVQIENNETNGYDSLDDVFKYIETQ